MDKMMQLQTLTNIVTAASVKIHFCHLSMVAKDVPMERLYILYGRDDVIAASILLF